jgi:hypothetical protein
MDNREKIFTNTLASNRLDVANFNENLIKMGVNNQSSISGQISKLYEDTAFTIAVGAGIKYITLFTYRFVTAVLPSASSHLARIDSFVLTALNMPSFTSTAMIEHDDYIELKDQSTTGTNILRRRILYSYRTYEVTNTEAGGYIRVDNIKFKDSHSETFNKSGDSGTQFSFIITHDDGIVQDYSRIVGDIYQGNIEIIGNISTFLRRGISNNLLLDYQHAKEKIEVEKSLLGDIGSYNILAHILNKGGSYLKFSDDIKDITTWSSSVSYITPIIPYYNIKEGDNYFTIFDDASSTLKPLITIPSHYNLTHSSHSLLVATEFNNVVKYFGIQDTDDALTSYIVALINETAKLKYYTNINAYLTKYASRSINWYSSESYIRINKNKEHGFFIFEKNAYPSLLTNFKVSIIGTNLVMTLQASVAEDES